jgi:hypothetical protein
MKGFKEINRRPGTKLLMWERAKRYFLAQGYEEIDSRSYKYVTLKKGTDLIFLGKSGAIRTGKSASQSSGRLGEYCWSLVEAWEKETGKGDIA